MGGSLRAAVWLRSGGSLMEINAKRTADDGLDAFFGKRFGKFQRAEQIARIGNGQGRHAGILGKTCHLLDVQGTFCQRIGGMGCAGG